MIQRILATFNHCMSQRICSIACIRFCFVIDTVFFLLTSSTLLRLEKVEKRHFSVIVKMNGSCEYAKSSQLTGYWWTDWLWVGSIDNSLYQSHRVHWKSTGICVRIVNLVRFNAYVTLCSCYVCRFQLGMHIQTEKQIFQMNATNYLFDSLPILCYCHRHHMSHTYTFTSKLDVSTKDCVCHTNALSQRASIYIYEWDK